MTPDIETLIGRLRNMYPSDEAMPGCVQDAITALRAVQWRPISEAPKDGTRMLIAESDRRAVGWFQGRSWRREGGFGCDPTHYAPLPPLPAARASKEG